MSKVSTADLRVPYVMFSRAVVAEMDAIRSGQWDDQIKAKLGLDSTGSRPLEVRANDVGLLLVVSQQQFIHLIVTFRTLSLELKLKRLQSRNP